jgi:hypothetical protein
MRDRPASVSWRGQAHAGPDIHVFRWALLDEETDAANRHWALMGIAVRAVCILILVILVGWMTESRLNRDEPQRELPQPSVTVVGHYP